MLLDRKTYVVKERVAFAKLTATYDLLDAESAAPIGIAKEEPPSWATWLRLVVNKHMLPTAINIYEGTSTTPMLSLQRGLAWLKRSPLAALGHVFLPSDKFQKHLAL
jgi:hypothetical protein